MDFIVLLFAVSLLNLWEAQGSGAVTPAFVQTGKDLRLQIMTPVFLVDRSEFRWKFKDENIIRLFHDNTTKIIGRYEGRADISVRNYSLLLKNVQQNDSGLYSAHLIGDDDKYVSEYNVTVQDPVSPVHLIVDSVPTSSGSCNVTVTCSTQDSHHINSTFTCDNQTCSQDRGETSKTTTSAASLQVYLWNGSIICNYSNQVSWAKDVKTTENICPQLAESSSNNVVTMVLIPLVIIIIILGVIAGNCKKRTKDQREDTDNTVYAVPEVGPTAQPLTESSTNDASGLSPTSTYCLVGFPIGSVGSTETRGTSLPESVYAQLEKPARA
ncbi:SLAM family member 9-like [Toxotes jaculatrix]|uniref:SLAM family member 9-like n=1 Tax=Toxotes jaculatrix TaxID=941984 RepID=UPI001B3AE3AE|nr:SLAM family member 9-like [Toxotes jaculatrix]